MVTERPLSQSEYFELFLSTMRANGFVAVPVAGGALRIQPIAGAASTAPVGRRARAGGFVTEIFRVRHIDPAAAVETLRPMISHDGSITASRSSILVSDFADNISRVRQVLARIDVDLQATRLVGLDNSGAREIAAALVQLAPEGVSVVPIDSSNAIALRGDGPAVASLADIAQELDRRAAHGSEIRVVFLEHADAEQLLPVLQQVIGEAPTSTAVRRARIPAEQPQQYQQRRQRQQPDRPERHDADDEQRRADAGHHQRARRGGRRRPADRRPQRRGDPVRGRQCDRHLGRARHPAHAWAR